MKHSAFFPPLDGEPEPGPTARRPRSDVHFGRVTKKLAPGANGAKQWTDRFGATLVCVRYREDAASGRQYKTVEIVVGERNLASRRRSRQEDVATPVFVRIGYKETELRAKAKQAGALWDTATKLWQMPKGTAQSLGLQDRIVPQK